MELIHPRMFHTRLLNTTGLLLGLLLLLAMQVWAEDPQAIDAPLENSAATLPPVPQSPMPVPSIPSAPAPHGNHGAEMERQISEHIARTFEQEIAGAFPPNNDGIGAAILVPLFALFLIFGGPIILVIVMMTMHYRARARRERQQSENIAQLLAAGRDVPLELLRGDDASSAVAEDSLRKGVKNIGIGTGLLIFLTLLTGISIGAVGFIMIGLGISQLVVWKLANNKTAPELPRD